jgi:hypothetical protein
MIAFIKKLLGTERSELVLRVGSLVVFLFLWLAVGVRFDGDSGSYIDGTLLRSPLYPLIIDIFSFIDSSLNVLILFQLLLGLAAIHVFLRTMRQIFDFSFITSTVVLVFISLPYYFITVRLRFFIGNLIMTEAICYPLFLLAAAAIFHALIQKKLRFYLYFILITTFLILTRRQFLFLYPFFGLVWLTLFLQKEKIEFSRLMLLVIFIFSIIATNMIEKTYQYIKHDRFSTVPFTGRQLLVIPMFVANESDKNLFAEEKQRDIFVHIYDEMVGEGLAFIHKGSPSIDTYNVYERYYNHVSHDIIPRSARRVMGKQYDEYEMNALTSQMSLVLIKHNFKDFLKLYLKNIEVNSGKKPFVLFLILVFTLTLIDYVRRRSKVSLILLFALILQLGNYMLIALVEPIIWRYTVYTNQVLFTVMALCIAFGTRYDHRNNPS